MKLVEWLRHIAKEFAANGFTDELEKEIINNMDSFKIHDWLHNRSNTELSIGFVMKTGRKHIWFDRDGTPDLEEQIKDNFGN